MFNKESTYITTYDGWKIESIWNEKCDAWSIYMSEKCDEGFELRLHYFNDKPIVKVEEAKEEIDQWKARLKRNDR